MRKKLNILYTCDNAYLGLTSISMASVIENNQDADICFYLATEKREDNNFDKLVNFYKDNKQIEIKYLDCTKYDYLLRKNNLDTWGSNSYYVYWKLFAYDLIDEDYIWYLDSDVICLRRFDNLKLDDGKSLGAGLDSAHYTFNKVAHINEDYYYFNTGSLFIDINRWKKNKCINKVVKYLDELKYKPLQCDQDILAITLQEDLQVLSPKYDYLACYDYYGVKNTFEMYSLDKKPFYRQEEIKNDKDKIIFYHCLGGVFGRPWQTGNISPIKEEFERYREISCWPNYSSNSNMSTLFKIEKFLEFLPDPIYNKIHNLAQRIHVKTMSKK